jgi:hypothetical protein
MGRSSNFLQNSRVDRRILIPWPRTSSESRGPPSLTLTGASIYAHVYAGKLSSHSFFILFVKNFLMTIAHCPPLGQSTSGLNFYDDSGHSPLADKNPLFPPLVYLMTMPRYSRT